MIQDDELTCIERRLHDMVISANDSGGVSLVENAEWAARSLARVCREVRDLQQIRDLKHARLMQDGSGRGGPAVCECPLCARDPWLLSMSRDPK